MAIAWLLVRRMALPRGNPRERVTEARRLIGYSGAFLAVSVSTALVFFGLRYAYREAFGLDQLGFWLAANRISDVSTQLLGLFGSQLFVPRYTPVAGTAEGRRVALRYWTLAVVVMAAIPLAFCIAPHFLVRTFLSATYEPAIGFILAYMVGDFLRVSGSMAMNAAFARARLLLYVGIELSTVGAFAAMTLIGISLGWVRAPVIAYPIAYAASALVVIVLFLRSAARPPERAAPELP